MTTVPLEELRDRLDEVVSKSRRGEHVLITVRGQGIAELTPVSSSSKAIAVLRSTGKVAWNGGKPLGLRDIEMKGQPVSETVAEDRR